MTFGHLNRRLHLYLGMFLLPWFFMYGISSAVFAHPSWFDGPYKDKPQWTPRFERPYTIDVPASGDHRPIGARILHDNGLDGAFGIYREGNNRLGIYRFDFRHVTRLSYDLAQKQLRAEDQVSRWDHTLTSMHGRGGFEQESFLNIVWGIFVDIVCLGILLWIASGLYMWWHIPGRHRAWGWAAVATGLLSFGLFLLIL